MHLINYFILYSSSELAKETLTTSIKTKLPANINVEIFNDIDERIPHHKNKLERLLSSTIPLDGGNDHKALVCQQTRTQLDINRLLLKRKLKSWLSVFFFFSFHFFLRNAFYNKCTLLSCRHVWLCQFFFRRRVMVYGYVPFFYSLSPQKFH